MNAPYKSHINLLNRIHDMELVGQYTSSSSLQMNRDEILLPGLHPKKGICVWWSILGVGYFEVLKPGQIVMNANLYYEQFGRVNKSLKVASDYQQKRRYSETRLMQKLTAYDELQKGLINFRQKVLPHTRPMLHHLF